MLKLWGLLICSIFCLATPATGAQLQFYTEEYPPYNFQQNGVVIGFTADILLEMSKQCGEPLLRKDIQLMPWKRAYIKVLKEPGAVLFGMTRTPEREDLFKWVGPIVDVQIGILAGGGSDIAIDNLSDLGKYRIGIVENDVGQQLLLKSGVSQNIMEYAATPWSNLLKLRYRRIDLFAYDITVAAYVAKLSGFYLRGLKPVYVLGKYELYYAFNKETPDALVQKYQRALDELRKVGPDGKSEVEKIIEKYI